MTNTYMVADSRYSGVPLGFKVWVASEINGTAVWASVTGVSLRLKDDGPEAYVYELEALNPDGLKTPTFHAYPEDIFETEAGALKRVMTLLNDQITSADVESGALRDTRARVFVRLEELAKKGNKSDT